MNCLKLPPKSGLSGLSPLLVKNQLTRLDLIASWVVKVVLKKENRSSPKWLVNQIKPIKKY